MSVIYGSNSAGKAVTETTSASRVSIDVSPIVDSSSTTSSGIASSTTALAASSTRKWYRIQNLGTNPLFVREGASASTTNFDYILSAGTGTDDGLGGSYETHSYSIYTGVITIAGTSPRYVISSR